MTLLKSALKNIKKDLPVYFLTALQLATAFAMGIVMTSSVMQRYKYYKPFKDIMNSKGIIADFQGGACFDEFVTNDEIEYVTADTLKKHYPEIKNVALCHSIDNAQIVYLQHGDGPLFEPHTSSGEWYMMDVLAYDDNTIRSCKPELAEGRWLSTSDNAEYVEVVIGPNYYGLELGDTFYFNTYHINANLDSAIKGKVVGIIRENERVFGLRDNSSFDPPNLKCFWGEARIAENTYIPVIISADYCSKNAVMGISAGFPTMIEFYEDTTDRRIIDIKNSLQFSNNINIHNFYKMDVVNKNNLAYIFEPLKSTLPIIIVLLIMVAISSASTSALSAYRDMKTYAVFYISGLQWKHCAFISAIQTVLTSAAALVLTGIILPIILNSGFGFGFYMSGATFLCIPAIIVFYALVSLIMPFVILSGNTPKQILTR